MISIAHISEKSQKLPPISQRREQKILALFAGITFWPSSAPHHVQVFCAPSSGFGTRAAASITQEEIIDWLDEEMETRDWKPASRNRYQAAWSVIYRIAMKNKKVTENPASGIGKLQEDNSRVRFLSMEEEVKLIAKIRETDPDYVPILELALHSGMRTSESLRAVAGDYSSVTGMLTVHQRKNRNAPAVRYV